ncbi:MAG: HAD family hydrolase [Phycisphaerae bacterium]|nr:HAD family hydrolase [Phycisphaerae bacterium]
MANRAVFLDRDHTLIEDPGYLSDPRAVRLLPGVELAMKSLTAAGFKTVLVTNQSGIARGLITEEALARVHAELGRQLAEKGAHLDAIYYCPYHPEGTVEGYAIDSELRKPRPGMLLKAAEDMDIDLRASWMVGDDAPDVEAGQRAGCRTIRLPPGASPPPGEVAQEDVQADFTARNMVEAARIILRESARGAPPPAAAPAETPAAPADQEPAATGARPGKVPARAAARPPVAPVAMQQVCLEILRYVKHLAQAKDEDFNIAKVLAGIVQVLALLGLLLAMWRMATDQLAQAALWAQIAAVLQIMALTFFIMRK